MYDMFSFSETEAVLNENCEVFFFFFLPRLLSPHLETAVLWEVFRLGVKKVELLSQSALIVTPLEVISPL